MKPNDIVQPTRLALSMIKQLRPSHRGVVLSWPDRYKCVLVKWKLKKKAYLMAGRYVEPEEVENEIVARVRGEIGRSSRSNL
jgi:hypothetical protein